MPDSQDQKEDAGTRVVHSEFAEPSRPGGHDGVHQPMAPHTAEPPVFQPAERVLEEEIATAIAREGRLAGCDVFASVLGDVATLRGRVRLEFQRGLAIACASDIPGVRVVVSALEVDET